MKGQLWGKVNANFQADIIINGLFTTDKRSLCALD